MSDAFLPVISFFPGRSLRWVADTCRAGRIPGAMRIGRAWVIRAADVDAFVAGKAARGARTVADAETELRARGVQ